MPLPGKTENQWNLLGLSEAELAVLLEELERSAQWYIDLTARLSRSDYEYAIPRMADDVAGAIKKLHERLTYDREQLQHAVYGLRDLLKDGPVPGKKVRQWARTASISKGLLALAQRILGIERRSQHGGPEQWTLPDDTTPPDTP